MFCYCKCTWEFKKTKQEALRKLLKKTVNIVVENFMMNMVINLQMQKRNNK